MSVRFGVSVLLKCLLYVRVSKGSRGTCMRLLRLKLPVVMNLKKIQQLYEEVQPAMFHTQTESLQENCRGYENRVCGSW